MIPEHLTVLYDAECGFCAHCRRWLERQRSHLELEFLPRASPQAAARFPGLDPGDDELVVIDDRGGVYRGPDAFVMCLYALEAYRPWALRMSSSSMSICCWWARSASWPSAEAMPVPETMRLDFSQSALASA